MSCVTQTGETLITMKPTEGILQKNNALELDQTHPTENIVEIPVSTNAVRSNTSPSGVGIDSSIVPDITCTSQIDNAREEHECIKQGKMLNQLSQPEAMIGGTMAVSENCKRK